MVKYRSEIDGLRTVAVIPVILFHLGYSFIKGGFYGVDVFFVISGYLITKILTDNIENGNFSMFNFWMRRIKRLLPVLLTVVLFTIIWIPLLVFKPVVKDTAKDIFPAIFSYFNFHALFDFGSYWGGKSEQSFFLHTWSLSVEEQFYLLYPFFLFFTYKWFKGFVIPILIITVISFVLFFFFLKINKDVDVAFYMFHARIWELSIGGLVGMIKLDNLKNSVRGKIFSFFGICLILLTYFLSKNTIGYLVLLPVIGSGLVILFCTPNDFIGKILSTNLFVFIGKLSYSLYLWHWPLIVLSKNLEHHFYDVNTHLVNFVIILLTFAFSYLTYNFIENRTRNNVHTPKIVLAGIIVISSVTLYFRSGCYNTNYISQYNTLVSNTKNYNIAPKQNESDMEDSDIVSPRTSTKVEDAYRKEGIINRVDDKDPELLLLGDSHGFMWAKLLDEISQELNISTSFYTSIGSKPFFNVKEIYSQQENEFFTKKQKEEYAQSVLSNINKWLPDIVVIACRWDNISERDKIYFNELLSFLEKKNIKALLFTQPPVLGFGNRKAQQYFTYLKIEPVSGVNLFNVKNCLDNKGNSYVKSLVSKYSNVSVYDVCENMIENNKVKISLGKEILYIDDDHLSYPGTLIHKKNILSIIKSDFKKIDE